MEENREQRIVWALVDALKANREELGLSMYQVQKMVGISDRTVSKVESHDQNPTLYTLLTMAKAQEVDLGPILADVEKEIH